MSKEIIAITMPKWGLSMTEGKVMEWLVEEGAVLKVGDAMVDIETEKIANTFEALDAGTLSRIVATPDEILSRRRNNRICGRISSKLCATRT